MSKIVIVHLELSGSLTKDSYKTVIEHLIKVLRSIWGVPLFDFGTETLELERQVMWSQWSILAKWLNLTIQSLINSLQSFFTNNLILNQSLWANFFFLSSISIFLYQSGMVSPQWYFPLFMHVFKFAHQNFIHSSNNFHNQPMWLSTPVSFQSFRPLRGMLIKLDYLHPSLSPSLINKYHFT